MPKKKINNRDTGADLPDNWAKMDLEQKRQYRLNNFLNPKGVDFISPEAEQDYRLRARRLVDVYNVQEPDRVPLVLPVGRLPYAYAGMNMHSGMYDYEKVVEACKKFNDKYSAELEYFASPDIIPGRVLDLLDYHLYSWPGHGLAENAPGIQFLEGEYMQADEYDALIRDPSDFWIRTYLPRVFGEFDSFKLFPPVTNIIEIVNLGPLATLGATEAQRTLHKMLKVGKEYQKMTKAIAALSGKGIANGFPVTRGGAGAKAPFDTLGDTLRGTLAIMKDMYQRPEKLLKALDVIADITINSVLNASTISQAFMVSYPLHKGADGWMSQKQFETFYWPSLKKLMNAFIKEGLIQFLFAEGGYNSRLESVNEFPKGSVIWSFDQTDMFRAKKILGNDCCIQGNVPSSLLVTGSPEDVKKYCRKLIVECGKGGGYILSAGCTPENPKMENLRAMLAAVREYGVYQK